MKKVFSDTSWEEYLSWQNEDRKTLKRINQLIKDVERNGNTGIGRPEPLRGMDGYWSRRINDKDRLVYKIVGDEIRIAQCRTHYGDH